MSKLNLVLNAIKLNRIGISRIPVIQKNFQQIHKFHSRSFFLENEKVSEEKGDVAIDLESNSTDKIDTSPDFLLNEHDKTFFDKNPAFIHRKGAFTNMNLMERNQLSIYTFNYMLRIYSKEPAVYQRDAEKLFKELTSKKYIAMPTALTYTLMIQLYAKRGLYPEAEVIFSQMLKNNEIVLEPLCFDALILAYVKGNASQEKMENIVQEMERRYLKPTIVTYALLMEGCLHTKDSERLQGYLKKIAELGMEPNLRIYTSLRKPLWAFRLCPRNS